MHGFFNSGLLTYISNRTYVYINLYIIFNYSVDIVRNGFMEEEANAQPHLQGSRALP